ncbi:hypothetical protein AHAS_Ahas13G0380900 [Arachis hypogaea]
MWYESLKDEIEVGLRMLHTDKDAMDMARIGMRDNMVELFVVHKEGATVRKGCTIKEVQEIDGDEAAAPLQERLDFSGDDESEDDDYQPENDDATDEGDSDEQWSENSSRDSVMEIAFYDSDDNWNADGGLYDVDITTMKETQKIKQSVPVERVQGEFSASVNKGKEKVVATGLRDEDDGYESEELWDIPIGILLRNVLLAMLCKVEEEYGSQNVIAIGVKLFAKKVATGLHTAIR